MDEVNIGANIFIGIKRDWKARLHRPEIMYTLQTLHLWRNVFSGRNQIEPIMYPVILTNKNKKIIIALKNIAANLLTGMLSIDNSRKKIELWQLPNGRNKIKLWKKLYASVR